MRELPRVISRTVEVDTQVTSPVSGEKSLALHPESFGHDTDGNLTSDGRWTYIWDGENRLIEMKRDTSSPTLSSRLRLVFEYDHRGRRIRKTFYTHNGSGWVEDTDTVFLYDGWNLMGELNANSGNDKVRTYVWGLDLSGSEQGAGGGLPHERILHGFLPMQLVGSTAGTGASTDSILSRGEGGLLKVTDYTSGTTHHFVGYDGNGNVAALFDGTTGAATARYEYGPFGEPLRMTGTLAEKCPFRFSTKYTDNESGLVYYGYRSYNPTTGRWLSRDPIEEQGGRNLYTFVENSVVARVDRLGLQRYPEFPGPFPPPDQWPLPPVPQEPPPPETKGPCKKFEDWYQNEIQDTSWMNGLPNCPCSIKVKKETTCYIGGVLNSKRILEEASSDKDAGWVVDDLFPHPGAETCIRSAAIASGARQQCCYDKDGKLITWGAAGTVDRGTGLGHIRNDYQPYKWAEACDKERGTPGECVGRYLQVRPINNGNNCRKNPPS